RSTGGPMVLERMISTDRLPVGAWNGRRPVPSNPIPLGTVSGQGHPANWASILDMTGGKTGMLPCTGPWLVGSGGNRYGATFLTIGKGRVLSGLGKIPVEMGIPYFSTLGWKSVQGKLTF